MEVAWLEDTPLSLESAEPMPPVRLATTEHCRTALRIALVTAGVALLTFGPAHQASANWAYTTWGMTPEQVAAASKGGVHVLPPDKRNRDDADGWEIAAEGGYQDEDIPLSTGFMFDAKKGGLICVLYNATGEKAETLLTKLEQRYGKPAKQSDFYTAKSTIWHTPDDIELVVNTKPLAAAVTHCQAGR